MNSNNSPRWAPPHLSPSASFLIRAPISSDDASVTSSSSSEFEEEQEPQLDDAGSGLAVPAPETRPPLVPVARLTNDETETEEEEEEEDVFDEVDGDGFVVRVRMSSDDETDGGGKNPSLGVNFDAAEYSESSGEVSFDEVDGDGFSTGSRVHSRVGSRSSTPRPSTSIALDEGDNEKDLILGGGSRERRSLDEEEEEEGFNAVEGNAAGFEKDEVLDENSNAEKGEIFSVSLNLSGNLGKDGGGVDAVDEKDEILGGGLRERSSLVEGEEFTVVEAEETRNAAAFEKDEILDGNSNAGKDKILTGNLKLSEKGEVLDENSNAEKDEILIGNSNLSGDFGKVGGDVDVVDENCEILGTAPAGIEAKSSAIEMEMDDTEEESEGIDNAAADSNQDHEADEEEDDTVDVAFEKSESKADEGVIGGSSSLVDSDIAKSFVEEEKAVAKLEESSIGSDAKPKYAENDDLFEVNSKTSGFEKEIEETHAAEDVEIMDEKGVEEGGGGHISGEQMATEAVVEDEGEGVAFARTARLVRAMASSSDGNNMSSMSDALRMLRIEDPTGSDSSVRQPRPLKPAQSLQARPVILTSSNLAVTSEPDDATTEEEKKSREKVELIRVKFLRVLHRLGRSPEDGMANSVLNQLARIEDSKYWLSGYDNEPARMKALVLEREEKDELDFYCNILVIGKAGVGKSATINSIFEEEKALTNAFKSETTSVRKFEGVVDGIKIRVLDTPGLKPSILDQASNRKILSSVKKYMKRYPPDVVLYMDRLDTQTRDSNDLPLLKSITSTLGSSIWSSVAIALTHAAAAPPEGPNGLPLSYEQYVNLRSRVVQQSIGQAAGDMRFMNRVVLVENHPSCRRNRDGQRVLPNGSRWISELLLWCCSSKILSEAQSLPQVQDSSVQIKPRFRSPPIQFFLSSVLESRPHPKLSSDLGGIDDSDIDLGDYSDQEDEEDEYDQLPPFRSLSKSQIARLSKEHKRAYFEEYDYRVKLLQKKQWKEEIKRVKEVKKRGGNGQAGPADDDVPEDFDDSPQNVQVPLPDMALPLSFDCDNPAYLYRFLEPNSQFHTGYMLDANGWDHDYGYEGVTLEKALAIAARFPAAVSVRLRKDKKDFSIHLDSSASARHGESGSSLASFDMQTIGNQMAYFLEGERVFWNLKKKNRTTAGLSLTVLGDTVATGQKLADQFSIGKRVNVSVCTGRVRVKGDVAYGANLEATLTKKGYPIGQALAALGLSLVRHHGALTYGGTLQSEVPIGRTSKMAIGIGMNSGKTGQITVRTSCSEQLEIALVGLIPLAIYIFRRILYG